MADKTFTAASFADFNWTEIQKYWDDNIQNGIILSNLKGTNTITLGNGESVTYDFTGKKTSAQAQQDNVKDIVSKNMIINTAERTFNGYTTNDKVYGLVNIKASAYEVTEIVFTTT